MCKYSASTVWATDPTTSRVHRHKVRGQEVYWRRLVRGQVQDGLWLSQLAFLRRGWHADLIVLIRVAWFNDCKCAFFLGDVKLSQPIAIMRHICRKHGNASLLGKSELEWRRIDQLQEQCNDFRMIFCESICYNPHFVSSALVFDDNNMRHEILSRYLCSISFRCKKVPRNVNPTLWLMSYDHPKNNEPSPSFTKCNLRSKSKETSVPDISRLC